MKSYFLNTSFKMNRRLKKSQLLIFKLFFLPFLIENICFHWLLWSYWNSNHYFQSCFVWQWIFWVPSQLTPLFTSLGNKPPWTPHPHSSVCPGEGTCSASLAEGPHCQWHPHHRQLLLTAGILIFSSMSAEPGTVTYAWWKLVNLNLEQSLYQSEHHY